MCLQIDHVRKTLKSTYPTLWRGGELTFNLERAHVVDFDFVSNSQQTLECIAEEAQIQTLIPLDDYDQPLPLHIGSRLNVESTNHVAFDTKSTLVSAKVIARHLLAEEKLRKDLKLITMQDYQ